MVMMGDVANGKMMGDGVVMPASSVLTTRVGEARGRCTGAIPARVACKGRLVLKAPRVPLARLVSLARQGRLARLVLKVPLVPLASMVMKAQLVLKVLLDPTARMVPRAPLVPPARLARLVLRSRSRAPRIRS